MEIMELILSLLAKTISEKFEQDDVYDVLTTACKRIGSEEISCWS